MAANHNNNNNNNNNDDHSFGYFTFPPTRSYSEAVRAEATSSSIDSGFQVVRHSRAAKKAANAAAYARRRAMATAKGAVSLRPPAPSAAPSFNGINLGVLSAMAQQSSANRDAAPAAAPKYSLMDSPSVYYYANGPIELNRQARRRSDDERFGQKYFSFGRVGPTEAERVIRSREARDQYTNWRPVSRKPAMRAQETTRERFAYHDYYGSRNYASKHTRYGPKNRPLALRARNAARTLRSGEKYVVPPRPRERVEPQGLVERIRDALYPKVGVSVSLSPEAQASIDKIAGETAPVKELLEQLTRDGVHVHHSDDSGVLGTVSKLLQDARSWLTEHTWIVYSIFFALALAALWAASDVILSIGRSVFEKLEPVLPAGLSERVRHWLSTKEKEEVEPQAGVSGEANLADSHLVVGLLYEMMAARAAAGEKKDAYAAFHTYVTSDERKRSSYSARFERFLGYIKRAAKWFLVKVHLTVPAWLDDDPDELAEWLVRVDALAEKAVKGQIKDQRAFAQQVLFENQLCTDMQARFGGTTKSAVVATHVQLLNRLVIEYAGAVGTANELRDYPVAIMLQGPPNVGKSYVIPELAARLMTHNCTDDQRKAYAEHSGSYAYKAPMGEEFFEGYRGQPVWIADDLLQVRDYQGIKFSEPAFYINLINNAPCPLPMAFARKGQVFASPRFVFATTNSVNLNLASITDPYAFVRRWTMILYVTPKEQYCKKTFSQLSGGEVLPPIAQREIDPRLAKDVGVDVYEFRIRTWDRQAGNFAEQMSEPISFDRVVELAIAAEDVRRKQGDSHRAQVLRAAKGKQPADAQGEAFFDAQALFDAEHVAFNVVGPALPPGVNTDVCNDPPAMAEGTPKPVSFDRSVLEACWRHTVAACDDADEGFKRRPAEETGMAPGFRDNLTLVLNWVSVAALHGFTVDAEKLRTELEPKVAGPSAMLRRLWGAVCAYSASAASAASAALDSVMPWNLFLEGTLKGLAKGVGVATGLYVAFRLIFAGMAWMWPPAKEVVEEQSTGARPKPKARTVTIVRDSRPGRDVVGGTAVVPQGYNADEVFGNVVYDNAAVVWFLKPDGEWQRMGLGLYLYGTVIALPSHYYSMFKAHGARRVRFVDMDNSLDDAKGTEYAIGDLPPPTPAMTRAHFWLLHVQGRPHRDMRKNLLTAAEASKLGDDIRVRTYIAREDGWVDSDGSKARYSHGEVESEGVEWPALLRYFVSTRKGDCGAVIALESGKHAGKIVGLHVCGQPVDNLYGFAAFLTSDFVTKNAPQGPACTIAQAPAAERALDGGSYLGFRHLGKSAWPVALVASTALRPSAFQEAGVFGKSQFAPASILPRDTEKGRIFPYEEAASAYAIVPLPPPASELAVATRMLSADLIKYALPMSLGRRVLTPVEALKGVEGTRFVREVDRNTSLGLPWARFYPGRGKRQVFGQEFDDLESPAARAVFDATEDLVGAARAGARVEVLWANQVKDELLPVEKVRQGKVRIIACSPIHYTLALRMYFGAAVEAICHARIVDGVAVGVNPLTEWGNLLRYVTELGDNILAGDFKRFDSTQATDALWAVYEVLEAWYGKEAPAADVAVRRGLWAEIVNSIHVQGSELVEYDHCNPSGNGLTSIVNSLYVQLWVRIAYLLLAPEKCAAAQKFGDRLRCVAYGDDNLIGVAGDFLEHFNYQSLIATLDRFGLTYTDEAKTENADLPTHKRIADCTFLKRGFELRNGMCWAPLDLRTVLEIPLWIRSGAHPGEHERLAQNVWTCAQELALHSPKVWDEHFPALLKAAQENGVILADLPQEWWALNAVNTLDVMFDVEPQGNPGDEEAAARGVNNPHPGESVVSAVSDVASTLTGGMSDWATGLLGGVASLFGFSVPRNSAPDDRVVNGAPAYALTADAVSQALPTGVIADSKVEPLPGFDGAEEDQMAISFIAQRPAFLNSFVWSTTDAVKAELYNLALVPRDMRKLIGIAGANAYDMTPLGYLASIFNWYSGGFTIILKIVKTELQTGRLVVVFSPGASGAATFDDSNLLPRAVIDLKERDQYTIHIPYMALQPWLSCDESMGRLHIFVGAPLVAATTAAPQVEVLVEVAGDSESRFASLSNKLYIPFTTGTTSRLIRDRRPGKESAGPCTAELQSATSNTLMHSDGTGSAPEERATTSLVNDAPAPEFQPVAGTPNFKGLVRGGRTHQQDAIRDFMAKPVLLTTLTWNTAAAAGTQLLSARLPFDPAFATVTGMWRDKLKGFLGFRGSIRLSFQVNANRFTQGRLLAFYIPMAQQAPELAALRIASLTTMTQLPRVDLNANANTQSDLVIPFVSCYNYYNMETQSAAWGAFYVYIYSALAGGGVSSLSVNVYMSFEDVELAIPACVVPQGDAPVIELGNGSGGSDAADRERFCIGEPYTSLRQLLKRTALMFGFNTDVLENALSYLIRPFTVGGAHINTSTSEITYSSMCGDWFSNLAPLFALGRGSVDIGVQCLSGTSFAPGAFGVMCSAPGVDPPISQISTAQAIGHSVLPVLACGGASVANVPMWHKAHSWIIRLTTGDALVTSDEYTPVASLVVTCSAVPTAGSLPTFTRRGGDDSEFGFFVGAPRMLEYEALADVFRVPN